MRALVFGVDPGFTPPERSLDDGTHEGRLLQGLATTPMTLQDVPGPKLLGDDWVVLRSPMTGICGSDTKQVFMDMGLDEWRDAFETLAKQHDTGAIKVAFDFRDQQ